MRTIVLPALAAASVLLTGVAGCSNRGSETAADSSAVSADAVSTEVKVEEVFSGSETLNGTQLSLSLIHI